jgi:hypothetical protein
MPLFTVRARESRRLPEWRSLAFLVQMRPQRVSEVEQDEERCLEAMLPWRDPSVRRRNLRCRPRTLVDDNPASG